MYCRCFCPGTLKEMKKDISISYQGKEFRLEGIVIKKCENSACRDGTIPEVTWNYVKAMIGDIPEGMESYRVAKLIFQAFREQ